MACPSWLNRGFSLGTVFGLLIGAGAATGWFTLRDRLAEGPADEPFFKAKLSDREAAEQLRKFQEHPLYLVLEDRKKEKAVLGCKGLAMACEAYATDPTNNTFPMRLLDLVGTGERGTAYLKNGVEPLVDPWGKAYRLQRSNRKDGSEYALVTTTAPHGTPISQFGIGEAAKPKE